MQKKKIILLASIAGGIVLLGIAIALLLTPITTFLNQGTGEGFRNVGSCSGVTAQTTKEPSSAFITPQPSGTPKSANATPANPSETLDPSQPTPEPTIDPYEELYSKADTTMMKDIVNILLIGVDYSTERDTWSGKKEWHSDVMMILAVNFQDNRADLISLPRDTYVEIPGVKGIYKLNASINCGGDLYKSDGSFNPRSLEKVCESAEWMLGNMIPVDYYYAVTMTSLKELVDLCGGLDYDMDIKFHIQGRSYEKGLQHLNGQGFLDYCRVRKGVNGLAAKDQGDDNRVNRQKKILIALFRQMKADKLITKIPDIINTFDGELFTNCSYAQTAALAAFAYNLDPENIGMHSMGGDRSSLFQWGFVFTNQENRVRIIKKVYNVSVQKNHEFAISYARYRWCEMLYTHYMELINPLNKYVQKLIDEDDKLPEFTSSPVPSDTPSPTPGSADPSSAPATKTPEEDPTKQPEDPTPTPPGDDSESVGSSIRNLSNVQHAGTSTEKTRQYTKEQRELFEAFKTALKDLEDVRAEAVKQAKKARQGKSNTLNSVGPNYIKMLADVQAQAIALAKEFGYTKVKNFSVPFAPTATGWGSSPWAVNYGKDKKFNEIYVDFN